MNSKTRATLDALQVVGYEQLTLFGASELAAELYVDEALDGREFQCEIDKSVSVSALDEDEVTMIFDDGVIDEQCQRHFHQVGV